MCSSGGPARQELAPTGAWPSQPVMTPPAPRITGMLSEGKVFDFRPYALIDDLGLLKPRGWSYEDTAAYGHFGRATFPWERLDRVDKLKRLFKV